MVDLRLLEDYKSLFSGNDEAYGTESGGCVRKPPPWEEHLDGVQAIGIYPLYLEDLMRPDHWSVNFGCIDLDVKSPTKKSGDYDTPQDAMNAAINLTRALSALGLKGWIEQTRSDGRHVWVFKRAPASTMRRALLVACQLAKVRPTEVNPKSEGFGNECQKCGLDPREHGLVGGRARGRGVVLSPYGEGAEDGSEHQLADVGRGHRDPSEGDSGLRRGGELRSPQSEGGREVGLRREGYVPLASPGGEGRDGADVRALPVDGGAQAACDSYSPQIGNYIRICYPGGDGDGNGRRRVYETPDKFFHVSSFVSAALKGVEDLQALEAAAKLYKAPDLGRSAVPGASARHSSIADGREPDQALLRRLTGLGRLIYDQGALEGADRSGTLFKQAVWMAHRKWEADDAVEVLWATDERHFGKYTTRKDPFAMYYQTYSRAQAAQ